MSSQYRFLDCQLQWSCQVRTDENISTKILVNHSGGKGKKTRKLNGDVASIYGNTCRNSRKMATAKKSHFQITFKTRNALNGESNGKNAWSIDALSTTLKVLLLDVGKIVRSVHPIGTRNLK